MKKKNSIVFPLFIALIIVTGVYFLIRLIVVWVTPRPLDLGIQNSNFKPCPDYPACVNTQADSTDEAHAIAPIEHVLSVSEARERIIQIMSRTQGSSLITAADDYLYYEIKVKPFGFKDDVEFYFPGDAEAIQIRSSARVPYYDFDVNRKRVESIRMELTP